MPSFKLVAADGSIINVADLKSKKVFIILWATWCPPCTAEIPSIEKLYNKVDKTNTVFVMLAFIPAYFCYDVDLNKRGAPAFEPSIQSVKIG